MPQSCPLDFGPHVLCRYDCNLWHRGYGFCTARYNTWEESVVGQETARVATVPVYPKLDRMQAELTHLGNKVREHMDKTKPKQRPTSKGIEL